MSFLRSEFSAIDVSHPYQSEMRTIRPYGAYQIYGIASWNSQLLAIDPSRGYLLQLDPATDNTQLLNPHQLASFIDATGLARWQNTLWFTKENQVYWCQLDDLQPHLFVTTPYPANGVAVYESTVYITCQKAGYILVYHHPTKMRITQFAAPGIGIENLTIWGEDLWVCDRTEQTVYCLDRATGELKFHLLTPFEHPTGLTFHPHPQTQAPLLYIAYSEEEAYVRDDPNSDPPQQLAFRDRTLIHPLYYHHQPNQHYTLSNGFLLEMSYVEELEPLDAFELKEIEWRMALPAETHRQQLLHVESIGPKFTTEEIQDGQRVVTFKFDTLRPYEGKIFGWKARIAVWGIKYRFDYEDAENIPELSPEFKVRYLVDDDDLAMTTETIQRAAREAVGTETNLLRKVLRIRNTVYDRLSYSLTPRIDTPDVTWQRGVGSCGEYVGVLLALLRLNGIACRTVGRYKCPKQSDYRFLPLEPEYNHVWIEFYLPGFGWIPMESNPDDVVERGPYPTRFFMALPWYHAEMAKGIPFESVRSQGKRLQEISSDLSIGNLGLNHVRFKILQELDPAPKPETLIES
jgi:Transglutaminase-like superfamily